MTHPYVILAYYGAGGWWKVHKELFASPTGPLIEGEISILRKKGWSHIKIVKLP